MNKSSTPIFGANKIASLLSKYNYKVKTGDILAGTIVGIERTQTLVNLGLQHTAFLANNEIVNTNITNLFTINEIGEFLIIFHNNNTDKTVISIRGLINLRLWERFKQLDFKNLILFAKFEKTVWGGKLVNFDDLKIFIPSSHLPKYYRRKVSKGNILPIKILEVKDKRYEIVASSRLAILKKQSPCLYVGLNQIGCVLSVKPFGIFLNVYGIKCLLHISEIFNKKIDNINSVYKKGDRIKVKIIYVNSSQGKIAVSARQILD